MPDLPEDGPAQTGGWVYDLRGVRVGRSKGGVTFVLDIPELRVQRSSFTVFVGRSGCGKSTLLDLLGLVLPPAEAAAFRFRTRAGETFDIRGKTPRQLAEMRRRHLGYVLQNGGLMPFLTVAGNVLLARMLNPGGAGDAAWAGELVTRLGIADHLEKKPSQLSGGQRQRAAIARAIAQGPEVLLADEPTGSVDRFTAAEIRDLLLECARRRQISVLMVTHDEKLVEGVADARYSFALEPARGGFLRSTLRRAA